MRVEDRRFDELNDDLRNVPGEGGHGIRRGYLWMLVGDDDLIKPDRMVLRWLEQQGVDTDPVGARELITSMVPAVAERLGRPVTPWQIDHAIWLAARDR